tara:strand:+ start:84 stop:275 length:192 start_codon:yes stop_codon:yes gene_type:complete
MAQTIEEIKKELSELKQAIRLCKEWNSNTEDAKKFEEKTLSEFLNFKSSEYRTELKKLIKETV